MALPFLGALFKESKAEAARKLPGLPMITRIEFSVHRDELQAHWVVTSPKTPDTLTEVSGLVRRSKEALRPYADQVPPDVDFPLSVEGLERGQMSIDFLTKDFEPWGTRLFVSSTEVLQKGNYMLIQRALDTYRYKCQRDGIEIDLFDLQWVRIRFMYYESRPEVLSMLRASASFFGSKKS